MKRKKITKESAVKLSSVHTCDIILHLSKHTMHFKWPINSIEVREKYYISHFEDINTSKIGRYIDLRNEGKSTQHVAF